MYKIGQSNDIHILKRNIFHEKVMVIGGTSIDANYRIKGHSDGDIILHSIAEAIYGALGIGDLGTYFSDKDSKNKDICSREILEHSIKKMDELGFEIVNLDFTVICEKVHFAKFKDKILRVLQGLLKTNSINFKATRWEDFKSKKIQSNVVILLKPKNAKVRPLERDRLITFMDDINNSFTEEVIHTKKEKDIEPIKKSVTKKINDYLETIGDEPTKPVKKESKLFQKIKKIKED